MPYFDNRCGEITNYIDLKHFENFLERLKQGKYTPRKYILEKHNLKKSAQKYFNLLKQAHGEKIE